MKGKTVTTKFNKECVIPLREKLNGHSIYRAVNNLETLRIFMSCHVFSVWDFMSLIKFLQMAVAPAGHPWFPRGNPSARRFVNAIVLEEESDKVPGDSHSFTSHFEMYCQAMAEVGGKADLPLAFVREVESQGLEKALAWPSIPGPARTFMEKTFSFIESDKPHIVAAAFALGREHIIPSMFRKLLAEMNITEKEAPIFHYYLARHIHLDEDFHGPLSLSLLNELCGGEKKKLNEAEAAAQRAIEARIEFWDGVLELL